MKTKIKKVYYCDFCKKHSLRSLTEHEKHCTGNPNRECRLDGCMNYDLNPIIEKFKSQYKTENNSEFGFQEVIKHPKMIEIRKSVNNCPNCILTILKCAGLKYCYADDFNYKIELQCWWDDIITANRH